MDMKVKTTLDIWVLLFVLEEELCFKALAYNWLAPGWYDVLSGQLTTVHLHKGYTDVYGNGDFMF